MSNNQINNTPQQPAEAIELLGSTEDLVYSLKNNLRALVEDRLSILYPQNFLKVDLDALDAPSKEPAPDPSKDQPLLETRILKLEAGLRKLETAFVKVQDSALRLPWLKEEEGDPCVPTEKDTEEPVEASVTTASIALQAIAQRIGTLDLHVGRLFGQTLHYVMLPPPPQTPPSEDKKATNYPSPLSPLIATLTELYTRMGRVYDHFDSLASRIKT